MIEGPGESLFLGAQDLRDAVLALLDQRIRLAHLLGQRRHEFVEERFVQI